MRLTSPSSAEDGSIEAQGMGTAALSLGLRLRPQLRTFPLKPDLLAMADPEVGMSPSSAEDGSIEASAVATTGWRGSGLRPQLRTVPVRRDSEFGLFKDIEKRTQILVSSLEGCWGPAPRPPGFIALGHQQVLRNVLAGFVRTEAGVAAFGSHCAGWSPAK
jgi:hypothetical protein